MKSISKGKWRYLRYVNDGGEEMYNPDDDPHEWYNLAGQPEYNGIIKEMSKYVPENPHPIVDSDERKVKN
ncbi:hypothetical protein ES705_07715 [subsurface metagenome]